MSTIPYFSLIRLASMGSVFFFFLTMTPVLFLSTYFAILFCHYVLSIFYSRKRFSQVRKNRRSWPFVVFLFLLICSYPFYGRAGVILLFGVHHALNDTYFGLESCSNNVTADFKKFRAMRFFLNLFSYLIILRATFPMRFISVPTLVFCFSLSLSFFVICFFRVRQSFERKQSFDLILFESFNVFFVVGSFLFAWKISYIQFVFYHLFLWILHPFFKFDSEKVSINCGYLLQSIVLTGFFFLFTPISGFFPQITFADSLTPQMYFWGAVHILVTFALSKFNPAWVRSSFSAGSYV